ncbi:DUF4397 domain-containing protein [Microlunatus flavus]|uniref:DUF4397 domain-containing protein n=1 Tax=Microlunatus flavus TaxID=1036181 RepID=A0A1H9N433_9ACTN|nr:DUF4397 domain-containing protein [Microlunatus flavus]SER30672.1 protein of unknown function [Microlunatus flavus]
MTVLVRSRLVRGALALTVTSGALLLPSTTALAADTATVSILHAVPGATVDVYANGQELLSDFKPGTLTDPQKLPAGTYDLKVVKAGDGADGDAVAELDDAKVPAGANVTVVAHLNASGDPRLTAYANDVSDLDAGKARLVVRHDAAAPAVDVRANGDVAFSGLENPDEDSADLDAGTVEADVVLAGESDPVIGPADVELKEGTTTIVYAWGSADDDNLKLAVQTIGGMGGNPGGVPGGTGGQAAAASPVALGAFALGLAGLVLAAGRLTRRTAKASAGR